MRDGRIAWIPEQWEKTFFQWMENIRDWCILRQLWWGHRIPAWTCSDCGHVTVAETDPTACEGCGGTHIVQDEDVLDTWFSSALWPFSTMGWPERTPMLDYFYPTSLMVTGFDSKHYRVRHLRFAAYLPSRKAPLRPLPCRLRRRG